MNPHRNVKCLAAFTINELPVNEVSRLVFAHGNQYYGDDSTDLPVGRTGF